MTDLEEFTFGVEIRDNVDWITMEHTLRWSYLCWAHLEPASESRWTQVSRFAEESGVQVPIDTSIELDKEMIRIDVEAFDRLLLIKLKHRTGQNSGHNPTSYITTTKETVNRSALSIPGNCLTDTTTRVLHRCATVCKRTATIHVLLES